MSSPSASPDFKRRRNSSLGKIDVGDTNGSSLQTMPSNQRAAESKARRLSKLEERIDSDSSALTKFWLSFVELNSRFTWLTPALIMVIVYAAYFASGNYTDSNALHAFVSVSYEIPGTEPRMYGKGLKDLQFVGFYMIFFTFYREFLMQFLLRPFAVKNGLTKESKIKRFMEQGFSLCYYSLSGLFGLYIMKQTPLWYFNTTNFYVDYPHKEHEFLFKAYYLLQAAFWAQQTVLLILQVEAPRKDYYELCFHHAVTIALIFCSYRFHFTWMGLAVYITMDISDFFLAFSKCLNYLDSSFIGPFFALFIGTWVYLRHYLNLKILYSVLTEFRSVGRFDLNWEEQNYKCWISQPIVFGLLFALQLVNLYWMKAIVRIAYNFVFLDIAKDDRSDSEEEGEEEPADKKSK